MSSSRNDNRWVPFQCPLCFGLFRLKKSEVGSAGHCPMCQSLIRTPFDPRGESPKASQDAEAVLEQKSVKGFKEVDSLNVDERELSGGVKLQRKRNYDVTGTGADAESVIDWEEPVNKAAEIEETGVSLSILGSGVILVTLAVIFGVFYVKRTEPSRISGRSIVLGDSASQAKLKSILEIDRADSYKDEKGFDLTAQVVDRYREFDVLEIEEKVRRFLNSTSVTERLKHVRAPDRVRPLMLKFYGGEKADPEGFQSLTKTGFSYQDSFVMANVQTSDFLDFPIIVERVESDGGAVYQVDWESWVGHCELSPDEMERKKPTKPFLMRVMVARENYYNYEYSDERKWVSYRLTLHNPEHSFLAYTERNSKLNSLLEKSTEEFEEVPYIVMVKYLEGARSVEQLELVDVVCRGWLSGD